MAGGKENVEILLRGIIAFQSLYRGYRTRKAMKKVREEFSSIFADIEGDDSGIFDVQWYSHCVVSRPVIKRMEQSDNSTGRDEFCKAKVDENGKYSPDSSSKQIVSEGDAAIDLFDKEECENRPTLGGASCSTKLSPSALNSGREQTGKLKRDLQPSLPNSKNRLGEDLLASGEGLSSSAVPSCLIAEKQDSIENAVGCEKDTELTKGDENALNLLKLGNLRSMKKEALSLKEKEVQMELIWIQQAIESRKQYIKLKG